MSTKVAKYPPNKLFFEEVICTKISKGRRCGGFAFFISTISRWLLSENNTSHIRLKQFDFCSPVSCFAWSCVTSEGTDPRYQLPGICINLSRSCEALPRPSSQPTLDTCSVRCQIPLCMAGPIDQPAAEHIYQQRNKSEET